MGKLVVVISQICKWHGRGGVLGLKHKKAKLYTGSRTLMNIRKCFVLSTIPISSTFHNSSSLWVCLRCQARRKKWSIVDWAFLNFLLPAAPKLFQKQLSNGFVLLEQFLLEDLFRFQMSHSLVLHCCSPPPSSEWKTVNFGFLPGACIIFGSLGKGIVCCLECLSLSTSQRLRHYGCWIPTIMGCFSSCSLLVKTLANPMHLLGSVSNRVGEACVRRGLKILIMISHVTTRDTIWRNTEDFARNGGKGEGVVESLCISSCPLASQPGFFRLRLLSPETVLDSFTMSRPKLCYLAGGGLSLFSAPSSTVWYPWRGEFTIG